MDYDYHVSDEELICFMDSQAVPAQVRSHLRGCTRCQNELEELQSRAQHFEQLVAQAIPAVFPRSDLSVRKLRRRLVQRPVFEPPVRSLYNTEPARKDSKLEEDAHPEKTGTTRGKLLVMPQQRRYFRTPRADGVTFTDGDNLFRKGQRAYSQGAIEQAIEYWREAKIVFLRLDEPKHIAACDRNVAFAQTKLGQSDDALEQFRKAKRLFERIGDLEATDSCDLKIGELLLAKTGHSRR